MTEHSATDDPSSTVSVPSERNDNGDAPRQAERRIDRRNFVAAVGAGAVAAIAGCVGDDDDDDDSGPGDDSGGLFGDSDDDASFDDSDDAPAETDDDTADDSDEPADDTDDSGSEPALGGTDVRFADSFVIEAVFQDEQVGEIQLTMHQRGEDYYQKMEGVQGMGEMELYHVDGTNYQVFDGQCFKDEMDMETPDFETDMEEDDEFVSALDSGPDDTGTIDGEPVDIYEIYASDVAHQDEDVTVYVSSSTGYIRRMESPSMTMDFHSWGDVAPISPPDMDCQEMGGMPDDY